jgi:protein-S-isoprenylcysteine O-methyltransferase Ste14
MKYFTQFASREYPLSTRILACLLAGILFVFLVPLALIKPIPKLDAILLLPEVNFGDINIILGLIFMLIGSFYAQWSVVSQMALADGTPLPLLPTQKLLVSGPFSQCRNPMTFGTLMLYLGIAILVGSMSSIIVVVLFVLLLVAYIKNIEEKELALRFGQAYLDYKAKTPFFFPRIISKKR